MYGIAATVGDQGRKDIFWLGMGHAMRGSYFTHTTQNLGGIFTSVPAAVSSLDRPPVVVKPSHASEAAGAVAPPALVQRLDVFGLGLDYAMYHKTLWGNY